jgi:hypothetical protein
MLTNENSMEAPEPGSFENKAFDRILNMMPSPVTPRPDKENRRLTSQYSSSADGVLSESKPQATEKVAEKADPKAAAGPPVDIHNLWSQLLGAGLVAGGSPAIPGLEVPAPPVSEKPVPPKKVETEKKVEEVKEAAPPVVQKPAEPVDVVKKVVLKSHHKSLKE